MSEKEIRAMAALDEAAEKAGGFLSPLSKEDIDYDYRKMLAYCKEKGVDPLDLTIREFNRFAILPQEH